MLTATPYGHIEGGMGQLALETLAKVMPIYERVSNFLFISIKGGSSPISPPDVRYSLRFAKT